MPSPVTYHNEISLLEKSHQKTLEITYPRRKTVFDEIAYEEKKRNIPGAGSYGTISVEVDRLKLKSNLDKADPPTFAEASMRQSLECPGVGNYNAYRAEFDKRGSKWMKEKGNPRKGGKVKFPSIGAYDPEPQSYRLFSGIEKSGKKKSSVGKE